MIVHSHYPVGEPRAEREALAAVEAGYAVDVICLRWPDEAQSETLNSIRITRLPVQHVRGASALRSISEYVGFALRATVAAVRIHRKASLDIVYVHAPPDFLFVTAMVPRLLGSRVVLDIHDLSPDMYEARFAGNRAGRVLKGALVALVRLQLLVLGLYLPPVFKGPLSSPPPQTIISLPVHTAWCEPRALGAFVVFVAVQRFVRGLYLPPVFSS